MLSIDAYHRPQTLDQALALLAPGRTVVAGGTDLLVNPRYMEGVREVVDLGDLPLGFLEARAGWVRIGANVTMATVARSPLVRDLADGIVSRGAAVCGSPNIRNMATLVGNVAAALPSADTPPPLLALDAVVVLRSRARARRVTLQDFFLGPARSDRGLEELIECVEIQVPPPGTTGGFYKVGRTADDIATVNASCVLRVEDGRIAAARLTVGAVAPVPLRAVAAEASLLGRAPDEAAVVEAGRLAAAAAQPISDQRASAEHRRQLAGVCATRALRQAAGLAPHGAELAHA
ncbi:MAG TPA: FAD binding domain-containing protein [Candidatus Dormibacteraeota bacterium]|nr:FAD binding domain-containing protein [Candidatus Dormibacteraeota bacterium]